MNALAGRLVLTGLGRRLTFLLGTLLFAELWLCSAAKPASDTQSSSTQSADAPAAPELKTRAAVPFQARVNLVPVRVVVRDSQGRTVPNLRKEDFQVFEGRTQQVISVFSVDTATPSPAPKAPSKNVDAVAAGSDSNAPPANFSVASRFVALLFDDIHISIGDLQRSRIAADKYVDSSIEPTDRVAVLTMSGQTQTDFTDDRDQLRETLRKLQPRSVTAVESTGVGECPSIDYYQASQMINFNDQQAINVATQDALVCAFNGNTRQIGAAQGLAQSTAFQVLSAGDTQTQYALRRLEEVIRRTSVLPGQRNIVLVSPGFLYKQKEWELSQLIDRANRSNIFIDALDARGLYTVDPVGDISQPVVGDPRFSAIHDSYRIEGQTRQTDVLLDLADGTGGIAFHNSNDLVAGLHMIAAAPEVSYLLGISPQNLKYNGQFHSLKIIVTGKEKYTLHARKGYYAPKKGESQEDVAKQDIEDAVFSQEEQRSIPIEMHTQYYKVDPADAKLTILSHVDIRHLRFEKSDGRNRNNLTVVTAIFDRNGNFVSGSQKVVEFRLLDATLDRLGGTGVTLKTSFDVKPGAYNVRLVVRDSNAAQLSAQNGAVEIPY